MKGSAILLHIFKNSGKKIAYDSTSGAFIPLTALAAKMLGALNPPLPPICPTSLRYELAKYDSEDVSDTYDMLYTLKEKGLLFGDDSAEAKIILDGECAAENEEEIQEAMRASKNGGAERVSFVGTSELLSYAEKLKNDIFG